MPNVGDHRDSTEQRPAAIFRLGTRWNGVTQQQEDDPAGGFWEYSCLSCGDSSSDWVVFLRSDYYNNEFVCRCCYDQLYVGQIF